ncbi:GNAT family protein [Nocardia rosealba]|uniref:GNAT family N-acetyltransferase n=1 Tax=Nocardia TaxID=1817 RepID=UPI001CDA34C5|nr:GNAT family protein [Nocardia rosealba]MCA2208383.1 GNAT family N-acetyltransferase [Nocardia rosealba]
MTIDLRNVELIGARLRLRDLRADDLDVYQRIFTDPQLTRYMGTDSLGVQAAAASFDAALRCRGETPRRKYTLAITAPDDDTMVGTIGLLVEDFGSNAMIGGLVVVPEGSLRAGGIEAGRLMAAFAFGPLGIHRVWAGHRHDHPVMDTVMAGVGLTPEARLRQLYRTQGQWRDVCTYAALRPEWAATATAAERRILASRPAEAREHAAAGR